MRFLEGLLLLLIACIIVGAIRKIRGGTFLPPPGSDGDHHVRDKDGRWWRFNADDGAMEEVFGSKRKRSSLNKGDANKISKTHH